MNDQDQSQFTYPGSLNNDIIKNKDDNDSSDIKREEERKSDKNILASITPQIIPPL